MRATRIGQAGDDVGATRHRAVVGVDQQAHDAVVHRAACVGGHIDVHAAGVDEVRVERHAKHAALVLHHQIGGRIQEPRPAIGQAHAQAAAALGVQRRAVGRKGHVPGHREATEEDATRQRRHAAGDRGGAEGARGKALSAGRHGLRARRGPERPAAGAGHAVAVADRVRDLHRAATGGDGEVHRHAAARDAGRVAHDHRRRARHCGADGGRLVVGVGQRFEHALPDGCRGGGIEGHLRQAGGACRQRVGPDLGAELPRADGWPRRWHR